jgi:hypothetical protein
VTHILALTTIVRERLLPVSGQVVARLNQKVNAGDVVATGQMAREHALLDLARTFGISPDAADKMVKCKVGDKLAEGTVVAQRGGILGREVKVPRDGKVVAVGGGQILMEVGETSIELRAGIPGTVIQIIPDRGVVVQTVGALVQGIWGNGRMDMGLLTSLLEKPDDVLTTAHLDVSLRGSVILGGTCRDADTLRAAADLPVRGLILASLPPALVPLAAQMRYPIVVVDALGVQPMDPVAYKLLTTNIKREVTLNAEVYDRYTGTRPEIIIPLPVTQETPVPREMDTFAPGQQVRMRRAPHAGEIGTLSNLKPGLTTLPSGLRAPAGEVRLETGEQVLVPLINLEIVG